MKPKISVVVPAYNEGHAVVGFLDKLFGTLDGPAEVLVVYDFPEDTTAPHLEDYVRREPRLVPTLNTYGRGPAHAIRYGIEHATADVVVVTMADESDDLHLIEPLALLVERGAVVAAASRYSRGGRQVGGPLVKRTLSRIAGVSLYWLARVGTRDATNSFKAYSKSFVVAVGIDSRAGFEIGIELVAKARRLRTPVRELPTVWHDRTLGTSNFRVLPWLPHYLRWYLFAFGPRLDLAGLRRKATRRSG
ncbi:MAG: glycosyltransferase family 2 protein [Gaiellaceae bacterium]